MSDLTKTKHSRQLRKILVGWIFITCSTFGQLNSSTTKLHFPQITVKSYDSLFIHLKNNGGKELSVRCKKFADNFFLRDSILSISSRDSVKIWVIYSPTNNVTDKGVIIFESADSSSAHVLLLEGAGKYGDFYDAATFDKYDNELKSALSALVAGHTSLGYNTGRDRMFDTVDKQPGDTIECVYTGIKIRAANRTQAQSLGFDTEHTWPQGTFNQNEPMRSDIFHLFPTNSNANNTRSNYPFGKAVSNITWQQGGSKLGQDNQGAIVFEPRDVHKGDVARAIFYFVIRYAANYGNYLGQSQEQALRGWNSFDTVSIREFNRNGAIANFQLKRNPFIDHPGFVDRIFSFTTSNIKPTAPKLSAYPFYLNFDSTAISDSSKIILSVLNYGDKMLTINNISTSSPEFSIGAHPAQIPKYENINIEVWFKPINNSAVSSQLTIQSDGGVYSVKLLGVGKNPTEVKKNSSGIDDYFLYQNYPNPFNPSTKIKFSIPSVETLRATSLRVTLKVFDILGNEVATLVNEEKESGVYEVEFPVAQTISLCSGIYFYKLSAGEYVKTKKMILQR